ncbi:hypothetical protein ABH15_11400 [Methanoculleus taiwanensis]|uniref:Uncharacterized protein n=2 Tax=Methanoculleus taiwanensis TaxID=1550565 RepID=A0A498GZ30_9EURY|nr:hypothetical protein ABH15_11400 [Methanoculleus taiwanensis]
MNLILPKLAILLGIGLCLTAGCTSSPTEEPVTTTNPTVTPVGEAVVPTAEAGSSASAAGTATAVDYESLIALLPAAPAGWTADEPVGGSMNAADAAWSWAARDYTKGDVTATVSIQDSAYQEVGQWAVWDTLTSIETTEGYYRQGTTGGYPSWEVYSKPASYGRWVGVNDRFIVIVSVEDGTAGDLEAFANAIDYQRLGSLG